MELPDLEKLMTDVGPLVEAEEIRQYEDHRWVVAFDEDLAVEIEHDPDLAKLVFSAELGHPPAGEEAAAYKLLLNVAAMWRDTGGLRMGLNPTDDLVIQIYDIPVAGLELEGLEMNLRNFADTALHARAVLAGNGNHGGATEGLDEMLHHMRV